MNKFKHQKLIGLALLLLLSALISSTATAQKHTAAMSNDIPVRVNVSVKKTTKEKHLILYSKAQPLLIADFQGKYEQKWFGVAATNSGIALNMSGKTNNGTMEVDLIITVMFDKNLSWMKEAGKNDRILGHEQNHFDLTAIKACEMINALRNEDFTMENLNNRIKEIHNYYLQELNQVQALYDKETNHGTIYEQQLAWSQRISKQIEDVDCY